MESRTSGVFVGRARELGALERALDAARAGSGSTVLVGGDAGIGKTRLATELAERARDRGFAVLLGRAIDLVGTDLPYQPFVDALPPLGELRQPGRGTQLRVFEDALALLADRSAAGPVLVVLEDLHWADASTLDLVVFLAHHLEARRILLLATTRLDEPDSVERIRVLVDGVQRSGAGRVVELGPLARDDVEALLAACADVAVAPDVVEAIVVRAEGNAFFAEELLAAAGTSDDAVPRGVRDLLLRRVERLDRTAQDVLRLAAGAGREVSYLLVRAAAARPEGEVRDALRRAVEEGVLVADQATGTFRFRHALLAEAVYGTILPGEREELHARLAEQLARAGASPGELASHWAAAGRSAEALAASVAAAREAEAVFGLAEAHAHLERALALWPAVPEATALAGLDLAGLCAWAAERAGQVGEALRAVELARRAIELAGDGDPLRASRFHFCLGEYLYDLGRNAAGLAAFARAVELVPPSPPSPERAFALGSLAGSVMMGWRHAESLGIAQEALALAREVDAGDAVVRALTVVGCDLAYLGRGDEGVAHVREALRLAEEIGDVLGLDRAYVNLTDALTMLGRLRESAEVGRAGIDAMPRFGFDSVLLVTNQIETLLALGDWDEAARLGTAALGRLGSSFPYVLLTMCAELEAGRGRFDPARAHLEAASATRREDRSYGAYDATVATLALWERRFGDAEAAVGEGLALARQREVAQIRVRLCATGLRAQAELAALARARRDADAVGDVLARADELLAVAREAAAAAAAITPNAAGWLALAGAEHARAHGEARPTAWAAAAAVWDRLERPPVAAYCRWREAEALVVLGASRTAAAVPLRQAHAVAARIGARPLAAEAELLAQRARLDLTPPEVASTEGGDVGRQLGLTPREAEVLALVARGYTNREIADSLVISVRTAGVHVSHILRKLDAPNRLEAAAIAHRVAGPASG